VGDIVLLCEHEPVITTGRGAKAAHLLTPEAELKRAGVDLVSTGRGGDVTLHAPGQLVCYPIFDLSPDRRDVRRYVRDLTRCMSALCAASNIAAGDDPAYVGLWVDATDWQRWEGPASSKNPEKIGAIGVRISRWVTMHGFALNLQPDLALFQHIVPCGIQARGVTSVKRLTGTAPSVEDAARLAATKLAHFFEAELSLYEDVSGEPLPGVDRWAESHLPTLENGV
jgi:lipoyl(octanoyl) transferase